MTQNSEVKVIVGLVNGVDGVDRISLRSGDESEALLLSLSPTQARLLATELIAAVNRVEVKANLKSGTNMWRRAGESRPRLATAG